MIQQLRELALHSMTDGARKLVLSAWMLAMSAGCVSSLQAHAADWQPSRNIEIIAGAGPGSTFDRTARAIQKALQERKLVEQSVTVINRAGGGGALAWNYLNTRIGDGHHLAVIVPGILTNRITGSNPLSHRDVTPIAVLFSEYVVLAASAGSSIKSAGDVITTLRKDPTKLSIGVATALGGANHLAIALALRNGGVDVKRVRFVVFPSAPESVTAVSGKHIDLVSASPGNVLPQMSSGLIRAIAVTSPKRLGGALKDVPTWKEQGVDAVFDSWRGVVGPKGLTREQIAYWDSIFKKITDNEDWKRELEQGLVVGNYLNSKEAAAYLDQQYKELEALLISTGLAK